MVSMMWPSGAGSSAQPYIYNRSPPSLRWLTYRMQRRDAFGEHPFIMMVGDSLTAGSGAGSNTGMQRYSPGQQVANEIARRGWPSRSHILGMHMGTAAQQVAFDPRWAVTGTWAPWDQVMGGQAWRGATAGATLTYTPGYTFDRARLWYCTNTVALDVGGSFTLEVLDGSDAPVSFSTPSSGGAVTSQVISCNSAFDIVALDITVASVTAAKVRCTNGGSNKCEIYGIDPWNSTDPEVSVLVAGAPGFTTTDMVNAQRLRSLWKVNADLFLFNVGANDCFNDVPLATLTANLATLRANAIAMSVNSVAFWTFPPAAQATKSWVQQQSYVDAVKAHAASNNSLLIDTFRRWLDRGGQEVMTQITQGAYYDNIHPSSLGYRDIGRFLTQGILWVD